MINAQELPKFASGPIGLRLPFDTETDNSFGHGAGHRAQRGMERRGVGAGSLRSCCCHGAHHYTYDVADFKLVMSMALPRAEKVPRLQARSRPRRVAG